MPSSRRRQGDAGPDRSGESPTRSTAWAPRCMSVSAGLDILAGNAAVLGTLSPVAHLDVKAWNEVMAVNLTANWRLMRSFDALMRQSDAGRAIFVTCKVGREVQPFWNAYAASKAALENLTLSWAAEVERITKLRVNLVDPGPLRTRLRALAFPGEDPKLHPLPDDVTEMFVDLASPENTRNGEIVTSAI